jgi:vacuolar-type H+-ATPase subunit D/Vma8
VQHCLEKPLVTGVNSRAMEDTDLMEMFACLEEIHELRHALDKNLDNSFTNLASARFCMGPSSSFLLSPHGFAASNFQAKILIHETKAVAASPCCTKGEDEDETFPLLQLCRKPPDALVKAKDSFSASLRILILLAKTQRRLSVICSKKNVQASELLVSL